MMKSSLDHIPPQKQRELARALEILHEEFEDALKEGTADFKKRGRILKVILFGSYAKGGWVDEPFTMKGYRSDFDLLVIVNNNKLCDFAEYWHKAADRLIREAAIKTPVSFIVHSRREVNKYLKEGQYFFCDIRKASSFTNLTMNRWQSQSRYHPKSGCGSLVNILNNGCRKRSRYIKQRSFSLANHARTVTLGETGLPSVFTKHSNRPILAFSLH